MATKRRSNTLYTVSSEMPSKHRSRAIQRNIRHANDYLLKVAAAMRLREYEAAGCLADGIEGIRKEPWLRKVRQEFKGIIEVVDWSEAWLETMEPQLARLGIPKLSD